MYTHTNFKTKKALKEAVAKYNAAYEGGQFDGMSAHRVTFYQPGPWDVDTSTLTGRVFLEGPHYPQPHKWYAECEARNGVIVKVK